MTSSSVLAAFEAAIGIEAAMELATEFALLVSQVESGDQEKGTLPIVVRAKGSDHPGGGVMLDTFAKAKFAPGKPTVHHGRAWVVDGRVVAVNPQGSLWAEPGSRAGSEEDDPWT